MAVIGDDPIEILNHVLITNWNHGSATGVDGRRRVVRGINPIRADDINQLRYTIWRICDFLSQDIEVNQNVRLPYIPRETFISNGTANVSNINSSLRAASNIGTNYVDIFPPVGYEMYHLKGAFASLRMANFGGGDDARKTAYTNIVRMHDRVRVMAGINYTRPGTTTNINYLMIWSR